MATFTGLPAELRNRIYHLAFVRSQPIRLKTHVGVTDNNPGIEPAILRASKQIRNEAIGIFWGCNTFVAVNVPACRRFIKFLKQTRRFAMTRKISPAWLPLEDWYEHDFNEGEMEQIKRTVGVRWLRAGGEVVAPVVSGGEMVWSSNPRSIADVIPNWPMELVNQD